MSIPTVTASSAFGGAASKAKPPSTIPSKLTTTTTISVGKGGPISLQENKNLTNSTLGGPPRTTPAAATAPSKASVPLAPAAPVSKVTEDDDARAVIAIMAKLKGQQEKTISINEISIELQESWNQERKEFIKAIQESTLVVRLFNEYGAKMIDSCDLLSKKNIAALTPDPTPTPMKAAAKPKGRPPKTAATLEPAKKRGRKRAALADSDATDEDNKKKSKEEDDDDEDSGEATLPDSDEAEPSNNHNNVLRFSSSTQQD